MERRTFIQNSVAASLFVTACNPLNKKDAPMEFSLKNNINHSVCHWCFHDIPLETFLQTLQSLGIKAIDLMGPKEWPLLKKYGIHSAMCNGAEISLTEGWNDPEYHPQLIENYSKMIPLVAENGYTNLICFSGNRRGMSDEQGLENCVKGLSEIMPLAEAHRVVLQMELFNQQNHPDYMCDSSEWGVSLCKALGSEHFKLLYDIYHMQVQEGDIIHTIKEFHHYFGHYHTAGVPGRNEIDDTQELYYPAVMRAILETGFKGHVAQEFIPKSEDKIGSLKKAFMICDV